MKPQLSIVMPVFNEAENIKLVVDRFVALKSELLVELIFVEDGGSRDNTRSILSKLSQKHSFVRPLFTNNRGYGASIFDGLQVAKADIIGWTHADLQTDIADSLRAYELLIHSLHPQNTFIKGKRVKRKIPDALFTLGMSLIASIILQKMLFDINAQPKLFHRSFLEHMRHPPMDFSFDLYSFYLAKTNGYEIVRLPVNFRERLHGESKWAFSLSSKLKTVVRTIKYIWKMRTMK